MRAANLYLHFPFCRTKCSYCALHSRGHVDGSVRNAYVRRMVAAIAAHAPERLATVYFGGGTPALCDLAPVFAELSPRLGSDCEFTVELNPLDVERDRLLAFRDAGVNRISMGVQSLDDATLADMRRGYAADAAHRAFDAVRSVFDNAGVDLIVGYPGERGYDFAALSEWGLSHCSVYSLQLEKGTSLELRRCRGEVTVPSDDEALDRIREADAALASIGLKRYEISNYSVPGRECRHNLAVWRGEDYTGLGEGAFGREGLRRTENLGFDGERTETVNPERDRQERRLFRLRLREGVGESEFPDWADALSRFESEGLVLRDAGRVRLTARGTEVCDSVLTELLH